MPKIERAVNKSLALGTLLRVPNVNPNHRHIWAWRCLHNARARSKHNSFKDRSVSNHKLNLSLCNEKQGIVALVRNTQDLQERLGLWQIRGQSRENGQIGDSWQRYVNVFPSDNVSQMVTYYLWWVLWYFKEFKNVKLDKWQKMLLSLRSNSQTIGPYIQNYDSLCTRTDHYMLLSIVLHIVVSLYLK